MEHLVSRQRSTRSGMHYSMDALILIHVGVIEWQIRQIGTICGECNRLALQLGRILIEPIGYAIVNQTLFTCPTQQNRFNLFPRWALLNLRVYLSLWFDTLNHSALWACNTNRFHTRMQSPAMDSHRCLCSPPSVWQRSVPTSCTAILAHLWLHPLAKVGNCFGSSLRTPNICPKRAR